MIYAFIFFVCLVVDYLAKMLVSKMMLGQSIEIIKDVFYITYVQNTGAAFGIMQNSTLILAIISFVVVCSILAYLFIKKPTNKLQKTALVLICAGGFGNFIDRVMYNYVIDFFDFRIINFAVFNTADCFVVIGTALFFVYALNEDKKI